MSLALQLERDIKKMGYPNILVQRHGFFLSIEPEGHTTTQTDFVFILDGKNLCNIGFLNDLELLELPRPDNVVIRCKKCYDLKDPENGSRVCVFYWPE